MIVGDVVSGTYSSHLREVDDIMRADAEYDGGAKQHGAFLAYIHVTPC